MEDASPLSPNRRRRVLIALLILLLILLPLYLWPLRGGGLGGLPGASPLPGSVRDPRNASAVAGISGDVWDALMGQVEATRPSPPPAKPPRNLTMITQAEATRGNGLDPDPTGAPVLETLVHDMVAQLAGSSDLSDGKPGGGDTPTAPVDFLAGSPSGGPGGGTGGGNPLSGFGPGGFPGLGPLGGGGSGGPRLSGPGSIFDPTNPATLEPTPEPATLVLVGSNLALLGAAAWRRYRRLPVPSTG